MSGLEPRAVNDPHLLIRFFSKPKKNELKSKEAGRPIFEDVDYISIKWASDKTRELEAPAHSQHRMKRGTDPDDQGGWETYAESYPDLYAAYKAGSRDQINGTPLSELTTLTEARREELKAINIVTVEALASLEGPGLKRLGMDGRKLQKLAADYLERAQGAAVDQRHAEEVEELKRQLAELQARFEGAPAPDAKAAKGGKAKAAVKESAEDTAARASFEQMAEEDLRNYLRDATGKEPEAGDFAGLVDAAVKANAANRKRAA